MAEVWLASQAESDTPVVIKRPHAVFSADAEFRRLFMSEMKISSLLAHPNIVRVMAIGSVEEQPYIALEHIDGIDLRALLRHLTRSDGRLPAAAATYVAREVARALHHAHTLTDAEGRVLGLVHRDVSPSNVMLGFDGTVRLVDFGIAKLMEVTGNATSSNALMGKFAYAAPEQASGDRDIDHRSDQYSLGVVLYEMLTGRRLFGDNDVQMLAAIEAGQIDPPSRVVPGLPEALDLVCLRALARERTARFANCQQLGDALDAFLSTSPWGPHDLAAFLATAVPECKPTSPLLSRDSAGRHAHKRSGARRRWWFLAAAGVAFLLSVAILRIAHW
jgi:serine/threonine protein kinase